MDNDLKPRLDNIILDRLARLRKRYIGLRDFMHSISSEGPQWCLDPLYPQLCTGVEVCEKRMRKVIKKLTKSSTIVHGENGAAHNAKEVLASTRNAYEVMGVACRDDIVIISGDNAEMGQKVVGCC